MEKDERLDYAVLISLMTREEAEVMACTLRADGVDAFIGNVNHATLEWLLVPAFDGLQVLVPRPKLSEAKAAIRARLHENAVAPEEVEDRAVRRDRWKMWAGFALIFAPWILSGVYGVWNEPGQWLYGASGGGLYWPFGQRPW
jgi:hypothetical protein